MYSDINKYDNMGRYYNSSSCSNWSRTNRSSLHFNLISLLRKETVYRRVHEATSGTYSYSYSIRTGSTGDLTNHCIGNSNR